MCALQACGMSADRVLMYTEIGVHNLVVSNLHNVPCSTCSGEKSVVRAASIAARVGDVSVLPFCGAIAGAAC